MSNVKPHFLILAVVLILVVAVPSPAVSRANWQGACGVVDSIDYPIDGISIVHDDFGMYRAVFNGRHTGIDLAFDRYGDPVRAAARGRVTFSDPAGWNAEKGVVIIEHLFPDDTIYFTVYGHMEPTNGRTFPKVGQCVEKGDIVGSVGRPLQSASHLHYEVRQNKASIGGPGYWAVDPLDGGWMHPIDFTEQWQLRLNKAFRKMVMAGGGPTAPPVWQADGTVIFAEEYHLEHRTSQGEEQLWRLDVQGLTGVINLPDGRLLGRTTDDQVVIVDRGRFVAAWKADRPLRSPPLRLADSVVFVANDNRVVSYNVDGSLRWQTPALGTHIEGYAQSGDLLGMSTGQDGVFKLWVVDPSGTVLYQATAPAPVTLMAAPEGGFIVMVASQIGWLGRDLHWKPLMDIGLALGRNSQLARDPQGNVAVYPGNGQIIYAYAPNGSLRWQVRLTSPQTQPPLVGMGSGCLVYVLTADGSLLAYRAIDGALRGRTSLYAGGNHGHAAARFLKVSPDEQVEFSAGYLSIGTIDGPTLATMDCKR